jgi:hypothetical protein
MERKRWITKDEAFTEMLETLELMYGWISRGIPKADKEATLAYLTWVMNRAKVALDESMKKALT